MFFPRVKFLALFLCVLLFLAVSGAGNAQSGTGGGSFGTVAIGQTSTAQSVTLTFTGGGTLATQLALTQGAQNQDFAIVSGGTCSTGQSYASGGSCTVSVTFAPQYAGPRMGAVVLEDASGAALASSYISGVGSGPQAGFHVATRQLTTFPDLTFAADRGIAVDGNGNLFAASINSGGASETVVEVPVGCTTESCVKQLPGTYTAVRGLAVDGAGNLWVGDIGANNSITEIGSAGGYSTTKVYTGSFGLQVGVAVDGAGNVYFTGASSSSAYKVTELTASSGYATAQILASGYNALGGIAVDSLGDVFFADQFGRVVQEIVAVNGSIPSTPTVKPLGSGIINVSGLALDGGGNIYTTGTDSSGFGVIFELPAASGYATVNELSNQTNPIGIALDAGGDLFGIYYTNQALGGVSLNSIFELPMASAPSLIFSTPTAPGEIDTADGPHKVYVDSIGNQPLSLAGLKVSNTNFSLDASTTTCTASTTLAVGNSCLLAIQFNPLTTGNITGTVTVSDNTLNAAAGKQSIALSGMSQYTPLVSVSLAAYVVAVSQALPVTVTVNGGSGNPAPTGTILITAPGYSSAPLTLSGGSASVTIPAGTLSPGQPTLTATYQPDTASAPDYTAASVITTFVVTSTIMNVPTITVTPAVNSISLGQALTVTVAVGQVGGAPMPTGSVTLAGGNYTSPATTLSSGTVTITIPANSLIIGTDGLIATYTPDAASATIYVAAKGEGFVAVGAAPPPSGAAPVDFGSIGIGKTSAAQAITLSFPANATPATLIATTQGATGLDFAIVSGGTCGAGVNVAAGQSCTVNVTFTPGYAGMRSGAVLAEDVNGQTLAMTYIHGSGTGAQISVQTDFYEGYYGVFADDYPYSYTPLSDGFSHPNVAVDGAGNVFVADMGPGAVREIPAGCTSASCVVTVLQAFYGPSALAVDGAGNIFVAEVGNGDVKKIPPGCKSYSCLETVGVGFNQPYGVFVDASGNVFVADTFNNAVKEVVAAGGYTTINTLASGLDLPWSVVVNAEGDLFVAEGGDQCTVFIPGSCSTINTSLLEIPAAGGYKTVNTLSAGGFGKPFGLAIDGGGNVYEADYGDSCATEFTAGSGYATAHRLCTKSWFLYAEGLAVDGADNLYLDDVIRGTVSKMDYVDVPSMTFGTATLEGVADTQDGTQVVSVQNNGVAALAFTSIVFSDTSFKLDSTVNTCSTSTPLAAGASCYLAVDFKPTVTGPINATLTLTDNNLNQSLATQVIHIAAVALPPVPVILTTPANPTTATSATFTFSDTQTPITFVCSIDSLPFAACASPAVYSALGGGPHAFQVKAKDAAGNLSNAAVYNWMVNSVGPPAPVITSAPSYLTGADTATFSFTDTQAGVTYQCSLDGAAFTACTSGVSYSGLAFPPTVYIQVAHHSFAVKAMDASNNFSPETTRSWTEFNQNISNPVDFGAVPVGQTSSAQTITFNVNAYNTPGAIATIDAVTMGVTGLDFAVTDPGTCAVGTSLPKGGSCTLKATFTPKYAGQRKGAVLLLDAQGNGIGEAYIQGTGTAPQVSFGPYSTVTYTILPPQNNANPGLDLQAPVTDVTVDGAGNVFASDMMIASVDQSIAVSTGDIWKFAPGCTDSTCNTLAATERNATPTSIFLSTIPLILPTGLTMDGAGDLWVNNYYIFPAILPTVGVWNSSQCSFISGYGTYFARTAVDGAGDAALVGQGVLQSCYTNLGLGQTSQTTSFDFSTNTPSITVDPQGNYFVADAGNNAIKEVLASSNYTIDRTVGSGFSSPYGVASDAYGNIYVSDSGNNALKEIVAASGYTQVLTIATFDPKVITPNNLTVDAQGNVYIALDAVNSTYGSLSTDQFVKLDFSDAPSLNFPTATKIGTTDTTDGTLTATVKNNGNQPLTISGLTLSNTNFSIDAGATTCSASAPLAVGSSCTIGVFFTPNATGALTGTLTLADNALNASGATQQFALTGTGYSTPTTSTPTVVVAPASGSITAAQSDIVTVTVSGTSGSPTPTGTISLFGGNYNSAIVALSGGTATFTIPAGVLAVGSTTVNAVYSPDTASSTTYGTGAGSASISVTAVPTSTPTVTVTPAFIDITTQQSLAVTITVIGSPTPTGFVTLSGGNFASMATVLGNGSAIITIPSGYLPAGSVTLTAYYTPDPTGQANYTSASGNGLVAVEAAVKTTPTVVVTPASASILSNQPLQVTLQVGGGGGQPTPTGSVVLSSGSYASASAVLSQGSVIVSIPAGAIAVGSDTLTASYTPDKSSSLTFNSAAGSGAVTVNSPLATTTTLQASASSITAGSSLTLTATVAQSSTPGKASAAFHAAMNASAVPTGTVTFFDGTTSLGSRTLNASGVATFSISSLAVGSHSITASYSGDTGDAASTSAAVTITVTAAVPAASLTPSSLSFTAVNGTTSAAQTITLTNTGNAALSLAGISIGGTNASAFAQTNTCGEALNAGSNCAISVTFTPTSAASFSATLSVTDNAGGSPQSVALSGTGSVPTVPVASLTPASLTFTTNTGTTSAAQAATLSNTGNAPLTIDGISITGTNPADFAQTNTCGSALAAGASCSISVTFTPASGAAFSATLSVSDNASGSPHTVSLNGTGTVPPSFTISSPSPAQTVTQGGTANYTITATPQNGAFNSAISFDVSGLPTGATASFVPATVTPGSAAATSTLTVQTAAPTLVATGSGWKLATPVLALIGLFFVPGKRRRRWLTLGVLLIASLSALTALSGCGGGFALPGAASQSYTITVTGTSGADVQTTTVQLTVQ
jgi:hypothetical protein